jgi:hypothetical protein
LKRFCKSAGKRLLKGSKRNASERTTTLAIMMNQNDVAILFAATAPAFV